MLLRCIRRSLSCSPTSAAAATAGGGVSTSGPLRVGVVGSGPAGFYTAHQLIKVHSVICICACYRDAKIRRLVCHDRGTQVHMSAIIFAIASYPGSQIQPFPGGPGDKARCARC